MRFGGTGAFCHAQAPDLIYLCAYQKEDRTPKLLRVTISKTEVTWVENGSVDYHATILENFNGHVTAASPARLGTFTADLFLIGLGQPPGSNSFAWSRASVDGQSTFLRGECGKADQ